MHVEIVVNGIVSKYMQGGQRETLQFKFIGIFLN